MHHRPALVVILALFVSGFVCASARAAPSDPTQQAVLADGAGHVPFEVLEPTGTPVGTMLFVHGGGWADRGIVDVEGGAAGAIYGWLAEGWRVVAISYTESPSLATNGGAADPTPSLDDVAAFYDQTRQAYSGPLCAAGVSAGAHLAMMLAVVRPQLACVVSTAGPLDLEREALAQPWLVGSVFGLDPTTLRWWSPVDRWPGAHPQTKVWIGEAANDQQVPPTGAEFLQADPSAQVSTLPAPASGSGTWFAHSPVDSAALQAYYSRLNHWLAGVAGAAPQPAVPDPGPGGRITACDDGVQAMEGGLDNWPERWRLVQDGSGWRSDSNGQTVTATYGCDGRGDMQWAGMELKALSANGHVTAGSTAEFVLTAPAGATFASIRASFRGWFSNLAEWDVGLFASTGTTASNATRVLGCTAASCRGLATWPAVDRATELAPVGTTGDPDLTGTLGEVAVPLPAGTRRLAWRLACVSATGCDGASINPSGDPESGDPVRARDPIGHPAAFTVTGATVTLGPRIAATGETQPLPGSARRLGTSIKRRETRCRLPRVHGLSEGSARRRISRAGCHVRLRVRTHRRRYSKLTVVGARPAAGTRLPRGAVVVLTLSS